MFLCSHLIQKKNLKRTRSLCMVGSVPGGLPTTLVPRQIQHRREKTKLPIVRVMLVFSCPVPTCFPICPYLSPPSNAQVGTKKNKSIRWLRTVFRVSLPVPTKLTKLYTHMYVCRCPIDPVFYMFIIFYIKWQGQQGQQGQPSICLALHCPYLSIRQGQGRDSSSLCLFEVPIDPLFAFSHPSTFPTFSHQNISDSCLCCPGPQ